MALIPPLESLALRRLRKGVGRREEVEDHGVLVARVVQIL